MPSELTVLSYAVRPKAILKYLGQLWIALAALSLVPLGVAALTGAGGIALGYLLVIALLLGAGWPASRADAPSHLFASEGLAVVALAFVSGSLLFSVPMISAGLSPVEAVFESVSGLTTTGLSLLSTVERRPTALLFTRSWLQWCGGLGITVFAVALLAGNRVLSRRLVGGEEREETLAMTTRAYARRVLLLYVALTAIGIVAVLVAGAPWWVAVTHTLSAVSTGGFSTYDASIAGLPGPWAPGIVSLLSLAGAIALPLLGAAARRGPGQLLADAEVRALLLLVAVLALWLAWRLAGQWPDEPWQSARHGLLMAISAQTTTGFSSLPVAELDAGSKLSLILAMIVGGGVGSTAGGVKLLRLLIVLRLIQLFLLRAGTGSHAVSELRVDDRMMPAEEIQRALLLILLFLMTVGASWFGFVAAGHDPLDSLFDVVSATGTVGLSTGLAGPALGTGLKLVLALDMLLGRVEILAFLVLLYPRTWLGPRAET